MIALFEHSRSQGVAEADLALAKFNARWQQGDRPSLSEFWASHGGSISVLASLVKADLRRRFAEGEKVAVAEYLEQFPALQDETERVVSLVYEEFCLLEERGEAPDPELFCDRYDPWKDSLASQLRYHKLLSQVAGGSPSPSKYPEPGDFFLRFRLRTILGQGGAARVYLADDEDLGGRHRALKVSQDRGDEPSIMGRLEHRNIVPVLSVNRDPESGLRGLCMPFRPGRPLDAVLRRMEPTPPSARTAQTLWEAAKPEPLELAPKTDTDTGTDSKTDTGTDSKTDTDTGWTGFPHRGSYSDAVAWVVAALAEALAHAHSRGILHRDVKPANVLLTAADGPQLLDFNLAHDPHTADHAEAALRGGTLPYMAPEQLRAFLDADHWKNVGPAADLYALGLLLRELLTGQRPEAPGPEIPLPRAIQELLDRRSEPPASARSHNPKVPHAMDAIVQRTLAADPNDRYPDAEALAEDLHRYLHRRPLQCAKNTSRLEQSRNWTWRNRKLLRVPMVLLILISLLITPFLWVRGSDARTYAQQGFEYRDNSQFVAAYEAFNHALWLNPTQGSARSGMQLLRNDFYQQAQTQLEQQDPWGFLQSMEWAEKLGYEPALEDADLFFKATQILWDRDRDSETVYETCNRVIEIDPKHFNAYHTFGRIANRQGNYQLFRENMTKAIQHAENPERWNLDNTVEMARLYQQRAVALISLGDLQSAIDDLEIATRHFEASGSFADRDEAVQGEDANDDEYKKALDTKFLINHTAGKAYADLVNQLNVQNEYNEISKHLSKAVSHLQTAQEINENDVTGELLDQVQAMLQQFGESGRLSD